MYGPKRFFFYSVYESDKTGAPIAWLNRSLGSIDGYAAAIGRWLVTRDGFDLLVYYLPDYDYASHALARMPRTMRSAARTPRSRRCSSAAGGRDSFLERYAVVLCSDHGQAPVKQAARLEVEGALVAASNRAGMLYGRDPRRLAEALDGEPADEVALFLETGPSSRGVTGTRISRSWTTTGREAAPRARCATRMRARCCSRPRRLGVRRSRRAQPLGRRQHGALAAHDSEVPMLTVGIDGPVPASITEVKGVLLAHFGLAIARAA